MAPPGTRSVVAVLEYDPELGAGLPPDELEHARRLLRVPGIALEPGAWDIGSAAAEPLLGFLVLDGLVTVNVVLGDRVASELLGPGDVLHATHSSEALLPARIEHYVSERLQVAVLDAVFIAGVRRWPALLLALHERIRVQERRMAVHAAIGRLRRVEDRILALLWHLAERWGRMSADGVIVPLTLTHEILGHLSGAERPTVTLALGELMRCGDVARAADGGFLLRPASRARLAPEHRLQPHPRGVAVGRTEAAPRLPEAAPERRPSVDRAALRRRVAALDEEVHGP